MEENKEMTALQPNTGDTVQAPGFSGADVVFAWLSLLLGFMFCQCFPAMNYPFGGFLFKTVLYIATAVILLVQKVRIPLTCWLSALSAIVISGALVLTDNGFLVFCANAYGLVAYCHFVFAAFGNGVERGFSNFAFVDYWKALFVVPYRSFVSIFKALGQGGKNKSSMGFVKVLLGIGLTVIPTVIIISNLSHFADFSRIMKKIFDWESLNVGRLIASLIFALPLGMYGFGLYRTSKSGRYQGHATVEGCQKGIRKLRILPQITAVTVVLPILFLYGVFFVSQWKYYVSGFTGILPEGFSHADYAREGFFQLCTVSAVNLVVILALVIFTKRKKAGSVLLKLICTVFCLCTLVLIATAVAKMLLYIRSYGLTPKRIYATWFMGVIAVVFILVALGQYVTRMKAVAASAVACIVLFAGLSLCNVNYLCARYNVDRYLDGSLKTVDIDAMEDLGPSAVPVLLELQTTLKQEYREEALQKELGEYLENYAEELVFDKKHEYISDSIFAYNLPSYQAEEALREAGYTVDPPVEEEAKAE